VFLTLQTKTYVFPSEIEFWEICVIIFYFAFVPAEILEELSIDCCFHKLLNELEVNLYVCVCV